MKRIMVVGVSAGVGKSTFARELGRKLHLPVYHLDTFYWNPGWVEAPLEQFVEAQRKTAEGEHWIIEGNYFSTFDIRASKADTLIYLELPLYVCLYRVVKRWLLNIGKTRIDMGEGCKEKLDWEFIKFIITTYYPRKKEMPNRFESFLADGGRNVITLRGKHEIADYLANLPLPNKEFV